MGKRPEGFVYHCHRCHWKLEMPALDGAREAGRMHDETCPTGHIEVRVWLEPPAATAAPALDGPEPAAGGAE